MNALKGLEFLFSSRGVSRWGTRLVSVNRRFGLTSSKQINIIRQFVDCLSSYSLKANFFIPATLLERYIRDLKSLNQSIIEWGIHGYVHTDHSQLNKEEHRIHIQKAIDTFDRLEIPFKGFRCPYLKHNGHTRLVLAEMKRFAFDSSECILWNEIYDDTFKAFDWIKNFYIPYVHGKEWSRPRLIDGIIEIPVSLPDDDVLLDREHLDCEQIYTVWSAILKECHHTNEVFVLQLHPERFAELKDAFVPLIEEAQKLQPKIWMTTLSEVAKNGIPNGYQGAFCVTGDIDAITINDFFIRLRDW